jgi:hypothetical protein
MTSSEQTGAINIDIKIVLVLRATAEAFPVKLK